MPKTKDHFIAILALPFMVMLVIPFCIYRFAPDFDLEIVELAYGLRIFLSTFFFIIGFSFFLRSIIEFAKVGKGTLAPWKPTQHFVATGLYRHVRNPMIMGVLMVLLSESIFLQHLGIAVWCSLFFLINHFYFILGEEPDLEKRFGESYSNYKMNVRRWIPRVKPWTKPV